VVANHLKYKEDLNYPGSSGGEKCFFILGHEFGKEFAPLEIPKCIAIPEKIRRKI
jgi:hypothetical protein